jgi:hypothetical protein
MISPLVSLMISTFDGSLAKNIAAPPQNAQNPAGKLLLASVI